MKPHLSYTIWFSQRTGSTLLSKALESTGIAGNPSEWLTLNDNESDLLVKYDLDSYKQLQEKLWELGTTTNGVFGVKTSMSEPYFSNIINTFKNFPTNSFQKKRLKIWGNAFPNCKHIFLTRRNKIRLAVSWWKAIQSQEWHRKKGVKTTEKQIGNKYNYHAINHLFVECCLREAAIQEFFSEGNVIPLTIVYEDFILSYTDTVRTILDYLNLSSDSNSVIKPPCFEKLADSVSENWVQRFRKERQRGWKNIGW